MRQIPKQDIRVIRTKEKIRQALATLILEKPLKEIKIIEIGKLAGINRGTFYQHYKDVDDLLNQIENEMYNEFMSIITSARESQEIHPNVQKFDYVFTHFIFTLLTYIHEHKGESKALFSENGDQNFLKKIKNKLRDEMLYDINKNHIQFSEIEFTYVFNYLSAGVLEIIRTWIDSDFEVSEEELSQLIQRVLINGVKCLIK